MEIAMIRKLIAYLLPLVFLFACATFAQDVKKDVKKDAKGVVAPQVKKDAKPTPAATAKKSTKPKTMKFAGCTQPGCGFWVKSSSSKEVRSIVKRHTKRHHKIELTDKQLKDMVKKEGAK
jgi:predicted small metal-binding protein